MHFFPGLLCNCTKMCVYVSRIRHYVCTVEINAHTHHLIRKVRETGSRKIPFYGNLINEAIYNEPCNGRCCLRGCTPAALYSCSMMSIWPGRRQSFSILPSLSSFAKCSSHFSHDYSIIISRLGNPQLCLQFWLFLCRWPGCQAWREQLQAPRHAKSQKYKKAFPSLIISIQDMQHVPRSL